LRAPKSARVPRRTRRRSRRPNTAARISSTITAVLRPRSRCGLYSTTSSPSKSVRKSCATRDEPERGCRRRPACPRRAHRSALRPSKSIEIVAGGAGSRCGPRIEDRVEPALDFRHRKTSRELGEESASSDSYCGPYEAQCWGGALRPGRAPDPAVPERAASGHSVPHALGCRRVWLSCGASIRPAPRDRGRPRWRAAQVRSAAVSPSCQPIELPQQAVDDQPVHHPSNHRLYMLPALLITSAHRATTRLPRGEAEAAA